MKQTMKLWMLAAILTCGATVSAQTRFEAGTVTLQPRIGGTGSTLTNTPDYTTPDGKTAEATAAGGAFTGLDLEYYLSRRIGLAVGVNWSQAGTGWEKYDYTEGGIKYEVKEMAQKIDYIGVPLTVNWYVARGLALKTGVQVGFLVGAHDYSRVKFTKDDTDYTQTTEASDKDDFKKVDVMIPIGLSYDFKLPFVIDFRYNIGVTKVDDFDFGKASRNMQAVLTLGYKFKL